MKFDVGSEEARALAARVRAAWQRSKDAASLLFESPSARARFEETGTVSRATALELGLVGPAARASGVDRDVRRDHAAGIYRFVHLPVTTADGGDVLARALIRLLESERSAEFVASQLENLPEGDVRGAAGRSLRTASSCRSSRGGAARSPTSRSPTSAAGSSATR